MAIALVNTYLARRIDEDLECCRSCSPTRRSGRRPTSPVPSTVPWPN